MSNRLHLPILVVAVALLTAAPPAIAQGQGQGGGRDKAQKQAVSKGDNQQKGQPGKVEQRGKSKDVARPQSSGNDNKGRGAAKADDNRGGGAAARDVSGRDAASVVPSDRGNKRFQRTVRVDELHPKFRSYASSSRAPERLAGAAAGIAMARGLSDNDVLIKRNGEHVLLQNRSGVTLVDLDDRRARDLGNWRVDPYDDGVKSGAPSFCRSGEGHPVWGREWCLDKGFGLGDYRDLRWGRSTDIGDIIFGRRMDSGTLARSVLLNVLGDVVFNRLGLHALTLGYTDPLTGVWLGEPTGPQVLRVSSGGVPVAEFYDGNRDDRPDVLLVALRPW